jgi:hypothetical protein
VKRVKHRAGGARPFPAAALEAFCFECFAEPGYRCTNGGAHPIRTPRPRPLRKRPERPDREDHR